MRGLRQTLRLMRINRVLMHHGLDDLIVDSHLYRPLRVLLFLSPWNWGRRHQGPRGVRVREALEELGPIFIKFGQLLSTRRDLLPPDIADELAKLQDRAPPFPGDQARAIIEQTLGQPVTELFQSFDETPLASASVAQVHAARLFDGSEVVVKVLRPGIDDLMERDLAVMRGLAALAERFWGDAYRFKPKEVVAEVARTLIDELDLMREAANASMLRRNFEGSRQLYIPKVYWDYARKQVLVLERIYGTPIAQVQALKDQGIDMERLAVDGVEVFFTQVFRHNFFHADMHPGNIFVEPDGRYIAVDFGIVGSLEEEDKRYMADIFLAFFRRDYRGVTEAHINAGWIDAAHRKAEMEAAVRTVCEPVFQRPLSEISFANVLIQVFQVAQRFDFEVQPQLILLHKTLLNIEGLGRQLYPQLDLWATAQPFLEDWMKEQIGPGAVLKRLQHELPRWGEILPEIPALHHQLLQQLTSGKFELDSDRRQLEELQRETRRANQRTVLTIAGGALLIAGTLLITSAQPPSLPGGTNTALGAIIVGLSLLLSALTRR